MRCFKPKYGATGESTIMRIDRSSRRSTSSLARFVTRRRCPRPKLSCVYIRMRALPSGGARRGFMGALPASWRAHLHRREVVLGGVRSRAGQARELARHLRCVAPQIEELLDARAGAVA